MEDCPLCVIPKSESLLYEDELLYLVSTKKMKGHKVRVMASIKRHDAVPYFEERTLAYFLVGEYMKTKLKDESWYMFDNTYASVKDHWHLIAADMHTTDPSEMEQMQKTAKVALPINPKFTEKRMT